MICRCKKLEFPVDHDNQIPEFNLKFISLECFPQLVTFPQWFQWCTNTLESLVICDCKWKNTYKAYYDTQLWDTLVLEMQLVGSGNSFSESFWKCISELNLYMQLRYGSKMNGLCVHEVRQKMHLQNLWVLLYFHEVC